ncbi:pyridoxamine 5'-phosphate oxidase family protein [Gemmatimonas sp.]|uniref:pyridoxamine 5'-phosphate oxidase family protein n=1 Tax=Gemmatimonas sp. TaxID=1962908 RepID=UPI00356A38BF
MTHQPDFHVLDRAACEALLATQHVGRLAFTFHDRVDIEPIHYVYADGHIYGRTQYGTKVHVLAHHPWIAFEVDEIKALFEWRSVVVHGRIQFPDPDGSAQNVSQFAHAVEMFRTLVPTAFDADDPTPARELAFVIAVQEMTGRAATSGGAA